ncbi:T9SS type A sorting domain-containing protein [Polaribacter litorisediminis]|uniref:T9SS type A sorting domain-containing protein n=1 Tax=Polaribacter litorisediminis TaxID=1908341 RepID=UPI00349ECAD7|nr:T9SS type A sorting domain-containing protein [Polaribacter litorisediminis]
MEFILSNTSVNIIKYLRRKSELKVKDNSAMINVENLSKGVYLLHIENEDKKWSQLFIKK